MNREAREARMRGAGTRKVAPLNLVIQGTTPASSVSKKTFRDHQREVQTPTRGAIVEEIESFVSQDDIHEVDEVGEDEDNLQDQVHDVQEDQDQNQAQTAYTLPVRPVSTSPPEFNLTQDFEEAPEQSPPVEMNRDVLDEDAVDLSVLPDRFDDDDSHEDEDFVPAPEVNLSDVEEHESRDSPPPRQSQAVRDNYADRIKTYVAEEGSEESQTSFRNTGSTGKPANKKRKKAIALEVTQLDTDEPEFSSRVTMVDFVSQMVLETLEQERGKDVDEEQREVIQRYMGELTNRFLELSDINNTVYMQKSRVAKYVRTKNTAQEALLKVNEKLNEARVDADRKAKEYATKKRNWDDTRFVNEFLHDVEDVNNSLRGVKSSGVTIEPTVFDKLAHIEEQTQLLGKVRQLNGLLEFASQKLSK